MKEYISDAIETLTNKKIFEKVERFEKTVKLSKTYNLDPYPDFSKVFDNKH